MKVKYKIEHKLFWKSEVRLKRLRLKVSPLTNGFPFGSVSGPSLRELGPRGPLLISKEWV